MSVVSCRSTGGEEYWTVLIFSIHLYNKRLYLCQSCVKLSAMENDIPDSNGGPENGRHSFWCQLYLPLRTSSELNDISDIFESEAIFQLRFVAPSKKKSGLPDQFERQWGILQTSWVSVRNISGYHVTFTKLQLMNSVIFSILFTSWDECVLCSRDWSKITP